MIRMVHRIVTFCGGRYSFRIRIAYVFSFFHSLCQNVPLLVAAYLIQLLLKGEGKVTHFCASALVLLAGLCLGAFFQYLTDRLMSTAGYEVFAIKRRELSEHLRRLPMGYFTQGNVGRISSILSTDMMFIEENGMNIVADVVGDLFSQLVLLGFLFHLHPALGGVALLFLLAAGLLALPMNRESMKNSVERQETSQLLTDSVIEYLQGLEVAKSFQVTGKNAQRLRTGFLESRKKSLTFEKEHTPWERRLQLVFAFGTASLLALAIWLNQEGELQAGALLSMTLFLLHLFNPVKHLFQMDSRLTIMESCLNRLESLFAEKTLSLEGREAVKKGSPFLSFSHVSFAYGKEKVLKDISFKAEEGEMVALVGESGSGKTTIANLLARFWDVEEGEIRVGKASIKDLSLESLMENVSMVFQRVYLFEDTVYANIALGRENASRQEVEEAAKKARCYEFIQRLPYGFDTRIGEGGATLSGGEAQRISIARCILKDAPIVILDEATASVDADNEGAILEAMRELCRGRTVLVIAHRMNTIEGADQILVLQQGRIIERGTHESLMEQKGAYYRMVELQRNQGSWNPRKREKAGKEEGAREGEKEKGLEEARKR